MPPTSTGSSGSARRFGRLRMLPGVYGRQLPHADASPPERFFLDFLYGPLPRVQRVGAPPDLSLRTTLFSNVNSAIRRSFWERFPFADDLFFAEDQDWSRRVLLAGHAIRYEPEAAVRHSHAYTLTTAFKRFFDTGASAERGFLAGPGLSARPPEVKRSATHERSWRGSRKPVSAAGSHTRRVYELGEVRGVPARRASPRLPLWLKRRCSFFPGLLGASGRPSRVADDLDAAL